MSKKILTISLPICVGAITMALINFVDSTTIPMSLRNAGIDEEHIHSTYGIYSRGLALVQIATVFSSSIILPLIPLITKTLAENKLAETRSIIERTHRLTHLISWPSALGLFALTLPLNLALFTNMEGSGVLSVIGFSAVFTSLAILGTGILQGMNLEKKAAYIIFAGVIVKIITNMAFIKMFGLIGAGYSTLFVYIFIFVLNTYFIWKSIKFSIWGRDIFVMVLSSVIMGAIIGLPTLYVQLETWSRVQALAYSFIAIIAGVIIYFFLLIIMKVIKMEDLATLPFIKKFLKRKDSGQTGSQEKRGKGKGMTKLKKILWGLLIFSVIMSLPGIANRAQVEWNNNTYEMIIPYESIVNLVRKDPDLDEERVLNRLKDAGLQGVSLEPDSLQSLENKGIVSVLYYGEIKEMSLFDSDFDKLLEDDVRDRIYVIPHEKTEITNQLDRLFAHTEVITFKGKEMVLISGKGSELMQQPLGFAPEYVQHIKDTDLSLVLRLPNIEKQDNQYLFQQVQKFADENTNRVLFVGNEVTGYHPTGNSIKVNAEKLKLNQMGVYSIEFTDQKGFNTLSYQLDMDVIRLHSLNLNDKVNIPSLEVGVERAVRAVKERNMRSLFITMEDVEDPNESLENTEEFMGSIQNAMPGMFHLGKAEPFEKIDVPLWSYFFTLLAAVLLVSIAVLQILQKKWLFYLSIAGLSTISLAYLVLQNHLLVKGLALLVALVTPVLAVIPEKDKENAGILRSYGKAILITFIGIATIVALLNGNEYLVKMSEFKGVKLIYIFPIACMFLYAMWGSIMPLLKLNVRYWHLIVIAILGAIAIYYIDRSGNEGTVSSVELAFRQGLENLLYIRPRTKEFLIGFPFYILALYFMPINKKIAGFLLIPGVIGFLSAVNTFTHLHIPLYVSLLRTIYSLVLGLIVGYIFIFIYKKGYSIYEKQIKTRWFS